ncbi:MULTISPECIES: sigma factor-like helix-turn-helix DNA-binding protein [unclassified Lactococcus]|uniref:sigma factor-like helix-turn-helix DNA-binding protein n=1 Tax=unclassified Lactococcus TaxID=2643510 RepID=UPI0011C89170|nr:MULTISPECIES: sigma factor-like helix-turn-helix DNA-binding protein [unclassified Lactococcus]MQW23258.1 hypothetical protein [Lactococcus sp. dk101]TXK38074.1 hypothetical protein FVP42_06590 [Lactococcus sp. dk310]TXK49753.1 hypothetical protein FVP43_06560 [Lactococcus sp. dk322]
MKFDFVMRLYLSDFYIKMIERDKKTTKLKNIDKIKQVQKVCNEHIKPLSTDSTQMLKLRYISGLTQREVGEIYHINERTVRQRTSPTIRALKSELYEVLGDEFSS